jgi:hypothetical protein
MVGVFGVIWMGLANLLDFTGAFQKPYLPWAIKTSFPSQTVLQKPKELL